MTNKEREAVNYRFSGYQLPMIQLDGTGDAYVVLRPHPYYSSQPEYWTHNAFAGYPQGPSAWDLPQTSGWHGTLYPFLPNDPES